MSSTGSSHSATAIKDITANIRRMEDVDFTSILNGVATWSKTRDITAKSRRLDRIQKDVRQCLTFLHDVQDAVKQAVMKDAAAVHTYVMIYDKICAFIRLSAL